MRHGMRFSWLIMAAGMTVQFTRADDPPPEGSVVVVTVDGKESRATSVKFSTGTRRLAWLADSDGATEEEQKGPLALEVRELNSTNLTEGIVTFVKLEHLESAKYDYEKQVVSLRVNGLKEPLTGTLKYKGVNLLGFSASVDGKTTTFSGGTSGKGSVKTVTFSGSTAIPEPRSTGTTWTIEIVQPTTRNPALTVRNLRLLYRFPSFECVDDKIPVRKGPSLTLGGAFKRLEILANDLNTNIAAAEVEMANRPEQVIAIPLKQQSGKEKGTLAGFLGEVDVGWKLFPLHTIKIIRLTGVKKEIE